MRTHNDEVFEKALADIAAGKMVILVDDEDRENEGDLCMAADCITPEAINFMSKYGRGLVCLALTEERVAQLKLPMMVGENRSPRETAFTVSIEARTGVTTGISAADRAHTIRTASAPDAKPTDLISPGHVFPLKARPGGVLQRTGHTEGAVDLARLAGLSPCAVICEIMKDDGTMARYPDLEHFAKQHDLAMISIGDLIQYRLRKERLVRRIKSANVTLSSGLTWAAHAYELALDNRQFLAMTLGDVDKRPTLVRVHTGSALGDMMGAHCSMRLSVQDAIAVIERAGRGVILLIPADTNMVSEIEFFSHEDTQGSALGYGDVLREYGLGAQVLADLGLGKIRLLTKHPRRIPSLDGYGLEVVDQLVVDDTILNLEEWMTRSTTTH